MYFFSTAYNGSVFLKSSHLVTLLARTTGLCVLFLKSIYFVNDLYVYVHVCAWMNLCEPYAWRSLQRQEGSIKSLATELTWQKGILLRQNSANKVGLCPYFREYAMDKNRSLNTNIFYVTLEVTSTNGKSFGHKGMLGGRLLVSSR